MNLGVRFRVLAAGNVLPPASHPGFAACRSLWICTQGDHHSRVLSRNDPVPSLGFGFTLTNGHSQQRGVLAWAGEKMACASRVRIPAVKPVSLSVTARGISGISGGGGDSRKRKLTLHNVAELIQKKECSRVVVMAGAGISTPSGIPDFRSPGSGLYSNLQQYNIPYPEAIFELSYFFHNPKPFFTLAKELYPGNYKPNYAHYFLRLLHDKDLLMRLYTQNIDGLERVAGIPPNSLVEAHGTFATATCTVCRRTYPGEDFRGEVMADKIPHCPVCTGLIKPDIVFFGEELPSRFFLHMTDFPMADLLFVIGTSLEVEPFASLAGAVRSSVPRVLINRDLVGPFAYQQQYNDIAQLGDVVSGVEKLVELLGWKKEMQELIQRETEKLDAKDS
ncbi:NAD-dependent protein deacetylase sirtuin-3, mitochondrial isoform X1 [Alligator mississippiensis]|uniref:NAD-dependent protein deacetylase sirtuin-3, mitochondrial isoform X1 n=1 Tax=Alligator mississippiensis TaxID=8496 RepID=UPI002877B3EF|nr:NAD-dependent protein deacetylase sirtuin-3, mitochondrial isoform X1 [Alligator mississippiensis]